VFKTKATAPRTSVTPAFRALLTVLLLTPKSAGASIGTIAIGVAERRRCAVTVQTTAFH